MKSNKTLQELKELRQEIGNGCLRSLQTSGALYIRNDIEVGYISNKQERALLYIGKKIYQKYLFMFNQPTKHPTIEFEDPYLYCVYKLKKKYR